LRYAHLKRVLPSLRYCIFKYDVVSLDVAIGLFWELMFVISSIPQSGFTIGSRIGDSFEETVTLERAWRHVFFVAESWWYVDQIPCWWSVHLPAFEPYLRLSNDHYPFYFFCILVSCPYAGVLSYSYEECLFIRINHGWVHLCCFVTCITCLGWLHFLCEVTGADLMSLQSLYFTIFI
jgi:hypothetical protein